MSCRCIARVNRELRKDGDELDVGLILTKSPYPIALIRTVRTSGKPGRPRNLGASYCPFCGKAYPSKKPVGKRSRA